MTRRDKKHRIDFVPLKDSTDVPVSTCPACGKKLEAASNIETLHLPSPGDPVICLYCGQLLVFDGDMRQREATNEEIEAFKRQPGLWKEIRTLQTRFREAVQAVVFDLRKGKGKPS